MNRDLILEKIEEIQNKNDSIGFMGRNEHNLHLREDITEFIISLFHADICNCHEEIKTTIRVKCKKCCYYEIVK